MFLERGDVLCFAGNNTGLRSAEHFIATETHEVCAGLEYLTRGGFMMAFSPVLGGQ